jgi:protein TonB
MYPSLPVGEPSSACSQRCRLLWFVVGSLLLHVLLVALWRGEPPAGPAGRSTFEITLVARQGGAGEESGSEQQQAADNAPRQSDKSVVVTGAQSKAIHGNRQTVPSITSQRAVRGAGKTRQDPALRPERVRTPSKEAWQQQIPQETASVTALVPVRVSAASGSPSHGQHELSSTARYQRVRDELLQALLPHFDYPPVARRRGWQGRVRVGLLIEADGDLTDIRLVESSGYAVLDKAAVKNLIELSHVPAAGQWLDGRDMDVVLPVNYRLEER